MIQDLRNAVRRFLEQTQKVLTQRQDTVHRGRRVTQVRMGFGKVRRNNAAHKIAQFREKVHPCLGTLQREQLLELMMSTGFTRMSPRQNSAVLKNDHSELGSPAMYSVP